MKTANLKSLQPILVALALLAASALSDFRAVANPPNSAAQTRDPLLDPEIAPMVDQPAIPAPKAEKVSVDMQMVELENRVLMLEQKLKSREESGFLDIAWPIWLSGSSALISLIALIIALLALTRVKKQREEILKLKGKNQSLLTRVGGVEVQMEQERVMNRSQSLAPQVPKLTPSPPQPAQTVPWGTPIPDVQTNQPLIGLAPINKVDLINALNTADRQPLREAATAELNITSDSENALAMGRAIATELEEVTGGGSYWLVSLQGQNWLFPTDRTLKGFAAVQPAKGLFHYEQQTIAQPQLIEPALLELCGNAWRVKSMGRIATP